MAKNGRKSHSHQSSKKVKSQPAEPQVLANERVETPAPVGVEVHAVPRARVLCGAIDADLFESIFKPSFVSFDERHDDEPLRALVESIVTAIAMRSVYEGCRKLDDVFQRYLYYLESLQCEPVSENLATQALCDYWRCQVFMTLMRDSRTVFKLLLPNEPPEPVGAEEVSRNALLRGLRHVLSCRLGGPKGACPRERSTCMPLIDFSEGVSFPWIGFVPERIFGLLQNVPDDVADERVVHEFAIVMPQQAKRMRDALKSAIFETMLVDLVAAQHSKLFAELLGAHDEDTRLPQSILGDVAKRVRFDRTYQAAYDNWLEGMAVTKPLHRSSRIDIEEMNAVSAFYRIFDDSVERGLGVYLFHYYR